MRTRSLALFASTLFLASLTACSGTAVGTGSSGSSGASGRSGFDDSNGGTDGTVVSGGGTSTSDAGAASSEYEPLFGAPDTTTATEGSIKGLWAGTMYNTNDDVRIKLTSSSIVMAVKCNSGYGVGTESVIGLEVSAVVTSTSIRVLETKSTGNSTCKIVVRPQTLSSCDVSGSSSDCFRVTGTTVYFFSPLFSGSGSSSSGPESTLTKLSD